MDFSDLLGRPWALHGEDSSGMDCSTVSEAVLRRLGFDPPSLSPFRVNGSEGHLEEFERYLACNAGAFSRVGRRLCDARQQGDLLLTTPPGGGRGLFVAVDVPGGLFLTATKAHGVQAVSRSVLYRLPQNIVGVYRCLRRPARD